MSHPNTKEAHQNENNATHPNNNVNLPNNGLHVAVPDPKDQQHYSTLGHPVRHILKVEKICNSAPCTLDKKKLKEKDHNAPVYIITEPCVNNNALMLQSYHILPSPKLRAHELAILATPLVLGIGLSGMCKSKSKSDLNGQRTSGISDTSDKHSRDSHLDTVSLRYHNFRRRKGPTERRRLWSRRLLILSIALGASVVVLIIAVFVTWQMGEYKSL